MVIGDKTGGTLNTHTGLTPRFDLALLPNVTKGGGVGGRETHWRWDQQIPPTVVIKEPAEGSDLASHLWHKSSSWACVCVCVREVSE